MIRLSVVKLFNNSKNEFMHTIFINNYVNNYLSRKSYKNKMYYIYIQCIWLK